MEPSDVLNYVYGLNSKILYLAGFEDMNINIIIIIAVVVFSCLTV